MYKALLRTVVIISLMFFSVSSGYTNSDNSPGQNHDSEDIVKISISPVKLRLFPGGSMQLIATAYNSRGDKVPVTPSWIIESDVPMFGQFNKNEGAKVIFSAINSGSGSVIAVFNNLEARIHVDIYKSRRK